MARDKTNVTKQFPTISKMGMYTINWLWLNLQIFFFINGFNSNAVMVTRWFWIVVGATNSIPKDRVCTALGSLGCHDIYTQISNHLTSSHIIHIYVYSLVYIYIYIYIYNYIYIYITPQATGNRDIWPPSTSIHKSHRKSACGMDQFIYDISSWRFPMFPIEMVQTLHKNCQI